MQFHIMNNGLDSLRFGLRHYKKFSENVDDMALGIDEHFSELKFSTMAFHNAIELFTKKILYDVNELLIFTVDVNDDFIARLLHDKYVENNRDSHMDYWIAGMVEDTTYKTIDYRKSIEILKSIFKEELSDRDYEVLVSLGKMRNAMTHLGYWDDFGWYKILTVINDSLELVKNFYDKTIRKSERHFDADILKEIDSVINFASKELEETWWAAWEYHVDGVCEYFEEVFANSVDKVELDMDEGSRSLKKISFEREGKTTDLDVKVIPRSDAILLLNDNVILGAINMAGLKLTDGPKIDLDSVKIYYFKCKKLFSTELYLEWKKMDVCQTQRHLINQLEK